MHLIAPRCKLVLATFDKNCSTGGTVLLFSKILGAGIFWFLFHGIIQNCMHMNTYNKWHWSNLCRHRLWGGYYIILTFIYINNKKVFFHKSSKLLVFDVLWVLRCPKYNLTTFGKCVCVCVKIFLANLARELLHKIFLNFIFNYILT